MEIVLNPVGYVKSEPATPDHVPIPGGIALIEILPEYREALLRIEHHSHIWVITWFHQARRNMLSTVPHRINPDLPAYGVFGLRAPNRPNPLGLTLVRLAAINDLTLQVEGLDAIDGTPVVDIKPYYENDMAYSAFTPFIRSTDATVRRELMFKHAMAHHAEACPGMLTGVRMALLAEEKLGQLTSAALTLEVVGSPCLADTLQGLTRARLANPPRFVYCHNAEVNEVRWKSGTKELHIQVIYPVNNRDEFISLKDEDIFRIKEE